MINRHHEAGIDTNSNSRAMRVFFNTKKYQITCELSHLILNRNLPYNFHFFY
ncbi:MAG: hypothetical protein ACI89W_002045 [Gammaproteobacteria bacterium]|jgi:hypothetical protein